MCKTSLRRRRARRVGKPIGIGLQLCLLFDVRDEPLDPLRALLLPNAASDEVLHVRKGTVDRRTNASELDDVEAPIDLDDLRRDLPNLAEPEHHLTDGRRRLASRSAREITAVARLGTAARGLCR